MKVSAIIPTYNAAKTIRAAVKSILNQTRPPEEILILDDGSTDDTISLVKSYKTEITVFEEEHKGVASARNVLCERARGDLIAFLDSDDIWHPQYLEIQCKLAETHPEAVAFFTGHVDFHGLCDYRWNTASFVTPATQYDAQVIPPLSFFKLYNKAAGSFASMSYCCIPRVTLNEVEGEPFKASGAEDTYLFCLLALKGPVAYLPATLVAYRVTDNSLSSNRLEVCGALVHAMELLEGRYRRAPDQRLSEAFGLAFASKRREYAKILIGAGQANRARMQLWRSVCSTVAPLSVAKSLGLLLLTYMPDPLQPEWPSARRRV